LAAEVAELKKALAAAEAEAHKVPALQREVELLRAQLAELKQALKDAELAVVEVRAMLAASQAMCCSLERQLDEAKSAAKRWDEQASLLQKQMQREAALQRELERVHQSLAEKEASLRSSEDSKKGTATKEELEAQIQQLQIQHLQMQQRMQAIIAELEGLNWELKASLKASEENVISLTEQLAVSRMTGNSDADLLRQEIAALKSRCDAAEKEAAEANRLLQQANAELSDLTVSLRCTVACPPFPVLSYRVFPVVHAAGACEITA
jgi:chromosome segregation ATPase